MGPRTIKRDEMHPTTRRIEHAYQPTTTRFLLSPGILYLRRIRNTARKCPLFFYEIEHFAMAIAGEVERDVSSANAYTFMKILDTLYDSAKDGQRISIK